MYEVRMCKHEEVHLLVDFIKQSWDENHILVTDKQVLDFQHKSKSYYNFVVAFHKKSKVFHAVLGVISPGFYIKNELSIGDHIWLAIWKVEKEKAELNSLGADLLSFVDRTFKPKSISAIGINASVSLIYRLFGFEINTMNQWFVINQKIKKPKLIQAPTDNEIFRSKTNIGPIDCEWRCTVEKTLLKDFSAALSKLRIFGNFTENSKIKLDERYFQQRYSNHPTYLYEILEIKNSENEVIGIAIGREAYALGVKVFRLTELYLSELMPQNANLAFQRFLEKYGYEYVDFIEYGYKESQLLKLGFFKNSDDYFVPHLFEPFLSERVLIRIASKSSSKVTFSKGDSDLDRPNLTA